MVDKSVIGKQICCW